MPNGHDYSKKYGPHNYGGDGSYTVDCKYKCGCSMGPSMSHGPTGIDTGGECPGNPEDGKKVGGNADYDIVVERRIRALQARANKAEAELERVKPGEKALAEELAAVKKGLWEKDQLLKKIKDIVGTR